MKVRPLIVVAMAVVALFGTLWKRRIETARPVDTWEPVSLS